ncbi:hypothetical protein ACIBCT_29025 [Streptosporangium sp. NPDC050855]|uniref:effector-associated constant component EACC1 n=1 Tax=Streptosporangium sp. NPDC050855 TaxID=3366194 RepID=UPI0037A26E2C
MSADIIHIDMTGSEAEEELRSFYRWLQDDEDVRRHARVSLRQSSPRESEMGSALEAIDLVLSNGFELANFTLAYIAWRATRRQKTKVTFKRGDIEVTVSDADDQTVKNIIQTLNEKPDGSEESK